MNSRKKSILAVVFAIILGSVPALAVFNEKDLSQTLSVLRFELSQENHKMESSKANLSSRNNLQHRQLVSMMKKCNELALVLYSQNQDFTFDVTYALHEVTDQYEAFSKRRMPYDDIVARLNLEIERYERLVESLRRLPPALPRVQEVPDSISFAADSLMLLLRQKRESAAGRKASPDAGAAVASGMDGIGDGTMPAQIPGIDTTKAKRPFLLDEQGLEDRDSCLYYARNLLKMYTDARDKIVEDNEHYEDASTRLKDTYDYAQSRYKVIQKRIFIDGQDNYFKVLSTFPSYLKRSLQEARSKYGTAFDIDGNSLTSKSEWRGPIVVGFIFLVLLYIFIAFVLSNIIVLILMKKVKALRTEKFRDSRLCFTLLCGFVIFAITLMIAGKYVNHNFFRLASGLLLVFAWLVVAILLSIFIRLHGQQTKFGLALYFPVVLLGILVISFRIIFIPNKLVNLVFPPVLLFFFIWQLKSCRKYSGKVSRSDMIFSWITLVLMGATAVVSWFGYVLLGVQAFIWWLFQLAALETLKAIYFLLSTYEKVRLSKKLKDFEECNSALVGGGKKGEYIQVTWVYDMIKTAILPVLAVLSVPMSLWLAADVFDLTDICRDLFNRPFFNLTDAAGNSMLHLTMNKLITVAVMFFIFRFLNYLLRSFYRHWKLNEIMRESGQDYVHANQVNLTLANNIISIAVWGTLIIATILLLKIPMGAISIVAAGLATGIGLALKDVLNNFIYGIQLMSGRLRVGDYVECDGVRGKVESISYQSTQIETLDGALMAFTNTTLFNKNFKNLTRNNSYELLKISVGVGYGTDVEQVRSILTKALLKLQAKDKYGRYVIDPQRGITLVFGEFSESSIDLVLKQYVLVEEEIAYTAKAKEIIYNSLNENGISIPFPQCDIHVIPE